jgi:uncharacterized protein YaaQ
MKMILAIVQKDDGNAVSSALTDKGFHVTKLASTGGFLSAKSTALLCGVEDNRVNKVLDIIESKSSKRRTSVAKFSPISDDIGLDNPVQACVGGATIFVLNVERFEKI